MWEENPLFIKKQAMNEDKELLRQRIQHKINTRTKPLGSLGQLEEIALQIAMVQETLSPVLRQPTILTFAADHGITDEGVSVSAKEITWQQAINFTEGGAGISVFTRQHGIRLRVIDGGVDYDFPKGCRVENRKVAYGTKNMLYEPAMTRDETERAIAIGAECVREEYERGCNVIGFGEMGIGNTSIASLLLHHFVGTPLEVCVGRGAGLDDSGLSHKLDILKQVAAKYHPTSAMEALTQMGGLEIAMICGGAMEARRRGMIVLSDGFITSAAIMVATEMMPELRENVIFCHASEEPGHRALMDYMGGRAVLDLGMRLGEGTGVAISYPIIESALVFLNEMASFDETGIYEVEKHRNNPLYNPPKC